MFGSARTQRRAHASACAFSKAETADASFGSLPRPAANSPRSRARRDCRFDLMSQRLRAGEDVDRHLVVFVLVGRLAPCESGRIGLRETSRSARRPSSTGRNWRRSVTWIWQPPQVCFACFWNVGSNTAGLKCTPGRPRAFIRGRSSLPRSMARRSARTDASCPVPPR